MKKQKKVLILLSLFATFIGVAGFAPASATAINNDFESETGLKKAVESVMVAGMSSADETIAKIEAEKAAEEARKQDPDDVSDLSEEELADIELLAETMFEEAGGTHNERQIMSVGVTALNRVKHTSYPNTIREVLFQPYQYVAPRGKTTDECYRLAVKVYKLWKYYDTTDILPEDYTSFYGDGKLNHFYNKKHQYITPL